MTKAVKLLKDANISVKFNASMTPYNISDLDNMYKVADDLGVQINVATYMFPPIRKDKDSIGKNNRFDEKSSGKYMAYTDLNKFSDDVYKYRAEQILKCRENGKINIESSEKPEQNGLRCRAGKSTFWMTWDGKMMTCGIMDKPLAYPLKTGLKKAWESIVEQTSKLRLPSECNTCSKRDICNVCAAVCYTEKGDVSSKPDYMCKMLDEYINETEVLYKQKLNESK